MKDDQSPIRSDLLELLEEGGAHQHMARLVSGMPVELRGVKPAGQSHTSWRLIEHMRIAQHDILEFIRDPSYQSPPWPDGYWPEGDGPSDPSAWERSVEQFQTHQEALRDIVSDPATDLLTPLPHGEGQTILREAILVADHNAYHLGQLATLRALLSA